MMNEKLNTPEEDALHRFIDGFLGEDDKLDMLDHLSEHEDDFERVENYQHQNNLLRAMRRGLDVGDSRAFCPDLQAKIVQRMHHTPMWRRPLTGALAASVAIVAVAGGLYLHGIDKNPIEKAANTAASDNVAGGQNAQKLPDQPLVSALDRMPDAVERLPSGGDWHFPFAPRSPQQFAEAFGQVDLDGKPEQPIAWFNNHMDGRSIRQPDLSGHGLALVDVEVISKKPTPALHLTYHDQTGELVELFAGILSNDMRAAFAPVAEDHIALHWRLGDLMFALIAPSASPQLASIVATVSAAVEIGAVDAQVMLDSDINTLTETLVLPDTAIAPDSDLKINNLEVAAPLQGTMMFVPVPRPASRLEGIAVEPPQALPPVDGDEKAENL